jgi:hypothetical protein
MKNATATSHGRTRLMEVDGDAAVVTERVSLIRRRYLIPSERFSRRQDIAQFLSRYPKTARFTRAKRDTASASPRCPAGATNRRFRFIGRHGPRRRCAGRLGTRTGGSHLRNLPLRSNCLRCAQSICVELFRHLTLGLAANRLAEHWRKSYCAASHPFIWREKSTAKTSAGVSGLAHAFSALFFRQSNPLMHRESVYFGILRLRTCCGAMRRRLPRRRALIRLL